MIRHRHRLGETLRLIVNAARPDRVHVAPVVFFLRMDERIAVAFRGRGKNERGLFVLRQAERVVRPKRADFRASESGVRDNRSDSPATRNERRNRFRFRQKDEVRNVMLDETEILVAGEMSDVRRIAGDEVVDRDDAMALRKQPVIKCEPRKPAPPVTTETDWEFFAIAEFF